MKTRVSLALIVLAATGMSGCARYSEDLAALETRMGPSSGTQVAMTDASLATMTPAAGDETPSIPFTELLAREYIALARQNETAMDYKTARYFTVKAQAAQQGKVVPPGMPEQFGLSGDKAKDAREGRAELAAKLSHDLTPENFYALAKAQTQYDCWLDDIEDGRGNQGACASGFSQAMSTIAASADPAPAEVNIAPAAGDEPPTTVAPATPSVVPGTAPQAPAVAPQGTGPGIPAYPSAAPVKPAIPAPLPPSRFSKQVDTNY